MIARLASQHGGGERFERVAGTFAVRWKPCGNIMQEVSRAGNDGNSDDTRTYCCIVAPQPDAIGFRYAFASAWGSPFPGVAECFSRQFKLDYRLGIILDDVLTSVKSLPNTRFVTESIPNCCYMASAFVKPALIRWAVDRSGIPEGDLSKSFPHLRSWISGEVLPSLPQLRRFAAKTLTPFGYLFLREPPKEAAIVTEFRTISDSPVRKFSAELAFTLKEAKGRQEWMREQLIEGGALPLEVVGKFTINDSVATVVDAMRTFLKLPANWAATRKGGWKENLFFVRRLIDHSGIMVTTNGVIATNTSRPLNPAEFRGFVLLDEYAPLIFVNGADAGQAQIFTLAHEMAHVFIGRSGIVEEAEILPGNGETEEFCNAVAAEFLVPSIDLRQAWTSLGTGNERFERGARNFGVSSFVIARRAFSLGLVDSDEFFSFYKICKRRWSESSSSSGGDFYKTHKSRLGRRFSRAVTEALADNRITHVQAYRLTGIRGSTFNKFSSELDS